MADTSIFRLKSLQIFSIHSLHGHKIDNMDHAPYPMLGWIEAEDSAQLFHGLVIVGCIIQYEVAVFKDGTPL